MSEARDLLDGLVLEDGRRWGEVAAEFQRHDAEALLDPDGARYWWLSRPRGAAKTSDLAAICLVSMLAVLRPGSRLFAAAADRDQARLLTDAAAGYVRRTPELHGAFRVDQYRITASRTGSVLDVLASDGASSWGLLGDLFVCDELCQFPSTQGAARSSSR